MRRMRYLVVCLVLTLVAVPSALAAAPTYSVDAYSSVVKGNRGTAGAGVGVNLSLVRSGFGIGGGTTIDSTTATTDAAGAFTATFPNRAVAPGDQIAVHYATPPPADETLGGAPSVLFPFVNMAFNSAGSTLTLSSPAGLSSCAPYSVVVDGVGGPAPALVGATCVFTFAPPVSVNQDVRVLTATTNFVPPNTVTTTSTPAPQLGATVPATCSADYVTATVNCVGIPTSGYSVVRRRGNQSVALPGGNVLGNSTVAMPGGLQTGDQIDLKTSGGHVVNTLTLATLLTTFTGGINGSSTCQAGLLLSATLGTVCPASGVTSTPASREPDERSGGATLANVPTLDGKIPSDGDAIYLPFRVYIDPKGADAAGTAVPSLAGVKLTVTPRNGTTPAFTSANVNVDAGVALPSTLAAGRYTATWLLTDAHGDTRTESTAFALQGSATGPAGKNGKDGRDPTVRCAKSSAVIAKSKAKPKAKTTALTCTARVVAARKAKTAKLAFQLIQGKKAVVASGKATLKKAGRATVKLSAKKSPKAGSYTLVIKVTRGRKTTTYRTAVKVVRSVSGPAYDELVVVA